MNDYSDIGLNNLGFPKDAPIAQEHKEISAYEFDTNYNTPTGVLNYTNLSPDSRAYTAIVDTSNAGGAFTDIQDAINYVNTLGGGQVFIKAGIYTISGSILLFNNIELIGEDNDTTVIDFNNGTAGRFSAVGITTTRLKNIHFNNLQIKNSAYTDLGAIDTRYVDDFSVQNCKFNNNYNSGAGNGGDIYMEQNTRCLVENCFSGTSGQIAYCINSNVVNIRNNYSIASLSYGIVMTGGTATVCTNNTIQNPTTNAIYIDGNNMMVTQNHITSGVVTGIYVTNAAQRVFVNGNIIDTAGTASYGIHSAADNDNLIISNNIILGTSNIGIWLDDGDNVIVSGNRITQSTTGITVDSTCDRIILTGNQLTGCTTAITDNSTNGTSVGNITV